MYDQSFGPNSLLSLLRENDFNHNPQLIVTGPTEASAAAIRADALFWDDNPLETLHVRGKKVFRASSLQNDLILKKIRNNIRRSFHVRTRGRRYIVETLLSHLREGLPYRVYKRDVHRFYPSFSHSEVLRKVDSSEQLSWLTKRLLKRVFEGHERLGGKVSESKPGSGIETASPERMMLLF
jgi:hypothetical protein